MKKVLLIIVIIGIASMAYASITIRGSGTLNGSLTVHEYVAPSVPSNVVTYSGSPVTYSGGYVTYN